MSFESQVHLRPGGDGAAGPAPGDRELSLAAALAGDRQAAPDVTRGAVARGTSVLDLYVDVLQEALHEAGRLLESNRTSVAAERLASAITQGSVTRLHEQPPRPSGTSGRAVLAVVEEELHQGGGPMVADALEPDGRGADLGGAVEAARALAAAQRGAA